MRKIYVLISILILSLFSCSSISLNSSNVNSLIGNKLDINLETTQLGIKFEVKTKHNMTEIVDDKMQSSLHLNISSKILNYDGNIKIEYGLYTKDTVIYIKDIRLIEMTKGEENTVQTFIPTILNVVFRIMGERPVYDLKNANIPLIQIKGVEISNSTLKVLF